MAGLGYSAGDDLKPLPRAWLLATFLYGATPNLLLVPHVGPRPWWPLAVVVFAVGSAVAVALALASHDPPGLSAAERRLIPLYAAGATAIMVVLGCLLIGVANVAQALLLELFDVEIGWLRVGAQCMFLLLAVAVSVGTYVGRWKPAVADRLPGVPTAFATYDLGHTRERFVVQTVALVVALAIVLWAGNWWVTMPAAILITVAGFSLEPSEPPVASAEAVVATRRALERLGYDVDLPRVGDGQEALVNPLVQSVDLRARHGALTLAVGVLERPDRVATWEDASRLQSAARTLAWEGRSPDEVPPDVHPVLVLVDAQQDASLSAFAIDKRVTLVDVSTHDRRTMLLDHAPPGAGLEALGDALFIEGVAS